MSHLSKVDVILDKASIEQIKRQIAGVLLRESKDAVQRLGNAAVSFLSQMGNRGGHPGVARSWRTTAPEVASDGSVSLEVYSDLENQILHMRKGYLHDKEYGDWEFSGRDLIAWLEYGVKEHEIGASNSTYLKFLTTGEAPESDFLGTRMHQGNFVADRVISSEERDQGVVTSDVHHPGYAAYHFLHTTRDFIEQRLQEEANVTASKVSAKLS